jgi:hypothetical protein
MSEIKSIPSDERQLTFENVGPALKEYEAILVRKLKTPIYRVFAAALYTKSHDHAMSLLADMYGVPIDEVEPRGQYKTLELRLFQEALRDTQKWTQDTLGQKEAEIMALVNGFQLQRILKLIFVCRSMVLASLARTQKRVDVSIPTTTTYIQRVLFLIAKELFDHPSLMKRALYDEDGHALMQAQAQVMSIISDSILAAIADLLPVDDILTNYMNDTLEAYNFAGKAPEKPTIAPEEEFGFAKSDDEAAAEAGTDDEEAAESEVEIESDGEEEEEESHDEKSDEDEEKKEEESEEEEPKPIIKKRVKKHREDKDEIKSVKVKL